MRTFLAAFVLIVVSSLFLPACKREDSASSGGAGAGSSSNEIVLGEYGSMTGSTATFGTSSHDGIMLAVDQINAAGGVLGKPIRVITEDDQSKADEAVNAVQKLINRDRVVGILGEVASKRSLAAGNVCEKYKTPMLSPASTNPEVTRNKEYVFRTCFTDDFQGLVCGQFALKRGWKKVALLTDVNNDYSKGLSKFFKLAYEKAAARSSPTKAIARATKISARSSRRSSRRRPMRCASPVTTPTSATCFARRARWGWRSRSSAATDGTAPRR